MIDRSSATPSPVSTSAPRLLFESATPPLKPIAINKYSDKNLAIWSGISRSVRKATDKAPRMKNSKGGELRLARNNDSTGDGDPR